MSDIQDIVNSNLDSALDNDYDFNGWTSEDIALDLIAFAADCSDFTKEQLIPCIERWQKDRI